MNSHRLGYPILTMILLLFLTACSLFPPGSTNSTSTARDHQESTHLDESSILGHLKLPADTKHSKRLFVRKNNFLTLSAEYPDLSLNPLLDFMEALSQEGWFLKGNSAYKGSSGLEISYSTKTRRLSLNFKKDLDQAEWPDLLPPYLSYATPVFAFGRFLSSEKQAIPDTVSATKLMFEGVTGSQIAEYEKLLVDSGYRLDAEKNDQRFYTKDSLFVNLRFQAGKGLAIVVVGQYWIDAVPPPPWPDPLPEAMKRKLYAVQGKTSVIETEDGFTASAEDMSISDLYDFQKALKGSYGWSELSEENEMVNRQAELVLKIVSFSTNENLLIFILSGRGIEASP